VKPRTTFIICAVDLGIWALIAVLLFTSGSDQAVAGLDALAIVAVTALLANTALPAFVLTRVGRFPRAARALALSFPAAFVLMRVAVAASLP
jgi:hypothetical protein